MKSPNTDVTKLNKYVNHKGQVKLKVSNWWCTYWKLKLNYSHTMSVVQQCCQLLILLVNITFGVKGPMLGPKPSNGLI